MFDIRKGHYGYIHRRKLRLALGILFFLAGIIGFLVIGYVTTGSRRNLMTVAAVLLVLPMSKLLVILIALWPFKARPKEEYDRVQAIAGKGILDTELVITSAKDKTFCLDYCLVTEEGVLCTSAKPKGDRKHIEEYLSGYLSANGLADKVSFIGDFKAFCRRASSLPAADRDTCSEELLKIEGVLRGLAI